MGLCSRYVLSFVKMIKPINEHTWWIEYQFLNSNASKHVLNSNIGKLFFLMEKEEMDVCADSLCY